MSDLISRQDAINLLKKWSDGYAYIDTETELAIKGFQHLPSAQPKRPKGHWIDDGTELGCCCSECMKTLDDYISCIDYIFLKEVPRFCPNCGSDMREEGERGENDV